MKVSNEGLADSMRAFVPTIFTQLFSSFASNAPSDEPIVFSRDQRKFLDLMGKISYSRLSDFSVPVPEGQKGTYLQTLTSLKEAALHSKEKINEALAYYSKYIAILVNTPEMWLSTKDEMVYYNSLEKARLAVATAMEANFDHGKHNPMLSYGDAIARQQDWFDVLKTMLEVSDIINGIDRQKIKKSIASVMALVDVLKSKAKADGSINDNISPQVISAIADGAYQVAKELEFYSVVHFRSLAISNCLTVAMDDLTKQVKSIGFDA